MTLKNQTAYVLEKHPEARINVYEGYKHLLLEFYSGVLWNNSRKGTWSINLDNLWKLPSKETFGRYYKDLKKN